MKLRFFVLIAVLFLSACATGLTYHGYHISDVPFNVDDGKVVHFAVTRMGPLPAENKDYKINGAGIFAEIKRNHADASMLEWVFSFVAKNGEAPTSVKVEKVTGTGALEVMVQDQAPVMKNLQWSGRSAAVPMTKTSSAWLYSGADSWFVFKFTIQTKDQSLVVMYQPAIIFGAAKDAYLQFLCDK